MSGFALVLAVVDPTTGKSHLVALESVPLYRKSGRYPALCGAVVLANSITANGDRECRECRKSRESERHNRPRRRSLIPWPRRWSGR